MTPQQLHENYLLLFQDSFLTALYPHDNGVLALMLYYGVYSKAAIFAITTTASVLALLVDYFLARVLVTGAQATASFRPYAARYDKCMRFANRFGWLWVLVGFFDQAESALALVGGALKVRLWVFLTVVALGKALYFAVTIFY